MLAEKKTMTKFAILRTGKLKSAGAVRGMLKHNFREQETPNADLEVTPNNKHMVAQNVDDGMKRYRELMPEKVRKNAVHAIDYMITTSPGASNDAKVECLSEGLKWLEEKHGKENIIMASAHFDETTPHLHVLAAPIKDGKLNARHFIGGSKHRLSDIQTEFYDRLKSKNIDLDRGIKGSKATHTKIKDYYKNLNRDIEIPKFTPEELKQQKLKPENWKERVMGVKENAYGVASRLNEKIEEAVKPIAAKALLSEQSTRRLKNLENASVKQQERIKSLERPWNGLKRSQAEEIGEKMNEMKKRNQAERLAREKERKFDKGMGFER